VERRRAPGRRDRVEDRRNIVSVEVVKSTAVVRDGEIVEYHVEVKIGFEYEG
jgi:flavin-binding protein dodecin